MMFNSGDDSIVGDVRYLTGAGVAAYPLADITRNSNRALDKITALILKSDASWEFDDSNNTDLPIARFDIVAGQPDYSVSVTHLKLLKFRIKDPNGNWITLDPVSRRDLTDEQLVAVGVPNKYDKLAASVFPYPIPNYNSTQGGELQFQRNSGYFTTADTTKEPGFASTFHRLVSFLTSLDYTEPNKLTERTKFIMDRIGREPGTQGPQDPGSGMFRDLVEFYNARDYDRAPRMDLQQEDYGASAL